VVIGPLFCLGLGLASTVRRSPWRLLLGGVGCLPCMCGLIVTTALVPLWLFGSFMDYAIG
jgi:hypothetical protein